MLHHEESQSSTRETMVGKNPGYSHCCRYGSHGIHRSPLPVVEFYFEIIRYSLYWQLLVFGEVEKKFRIVSKQSC